MHSPIRTCVDFVNQSARNVLMLAGLVAVERPVSKAERSAIVDGDDQLIAVHVSRAVYGAKDSIELVCEAARAGHAHRGIRRGLIDTWREISLELPIPQVAHIELAMRADASAHRIEQALGAIDPALEPGIATQLARDIVRNEFKLLIRDSHTEIGSADPHQVQQRLLDIWRAAYLGGIVAAFIDEMAARIPID